MAYSYYVYTGNGSTTQYNIPFNYIRKEHVLATVAGSSATFTWVNASTIQMDTTPANGAVVRVYRETPLAAPLVDFTDGATLVAADLDTNAKQSVYIQQELDDGLVDGLANVIPNGDKGDITTSSAGTVWTIDTGAVTSAKILNDTILNADVNPTAGIVASKLSFTQTGTGATARTVEAKLKDVVSVKDFGAVGDGTTDDTAAVQAALTAAFAVFFPAGNYLFTGSLNLRNGNSLIGPGNSNSNTDTQYYLGNAKLVFSGAGSACIKLASGTVPYAIGFIGISNLTIMAIEATGRPWIFDLPDLTEANFSFVSARNHCTTGGVLRSVSAQNNVNFPWINYFTNCEFGALEASTEYGVDLDCSDTRIVGCYFTGGKGFIHRGMGGLLFSACHFDRTNNNGAGLTIYKKQGNNPREKTVSIMGCYFDENDRAGIVLDATQATVASWFLTTIVGCLFRNRITAIDIRLLSNDAYAVYGGTIVGCTMTGDVVNSFNVGTNWKKTCFSGNVQVLGAYKWESSTAAYDWDGFFTNGPSVITADHADSALRITQTGAGDALRIEDSVNPDSTPVIINPNGQVVIGDIQTRQTNTYSAAHLLQIQTTANNAVQISDFSSNQFASAVDFSKSRSATIGPNVSVSDGDALGLLIFNAADGTTYRQAAKIVAEADGAVTTGTTPGRIAFETSFGASSPLRRMEINNAGNLKIFNTSAVPASVSGGGMLYVEAGALKYRGSSGTVTTIANA